MHENPVSKPLQAPPHHRSQSTAPSTSHSLILRFNYISAKIPLLKSLNLSIEITEFVYWNHSILIDKFDYLYIQIWLVLPKPSQIVPDIKSLPAISSPQLTSTDIPPKASNTTPSTTLSDIAVAIKSARSIAPAHDTHLHLAYIHCYHHDTHGYDRGICLSRAIVCISDF